MLRTSAFADDVMFSHNGAKAATEHDNHNSRDSNQI